jgi:imidazolonepropionase
MNSEKLLIQHAAELITCKGFAAKAGRSMGQLDIIEDGALAIENGTIRHIGTTREVIAAIDPEAYTVIDAGGKAVLPGFIDAHTHFVFGGYRPEEYRWRLEGMPYMEIMQRGGGIAETVRATRRMPKSQLLELGRQRLDAMLAMGITTVEGKSGYGLDLETEIKQLEVMAELDRTHAVDVVPTFLGAHALPSEQTDQSDAYIDWIIDAVLPQVAERKLAEFCDVFCEEGVFSVRQSRRLLRKACALGLAPKLHADEIAPLGGAELAAELGAVSADHLLQASDKGISAMARSGVVATLLPATAFNLKEPFARARHIIDSGCAVALASDFNPGSSFTYAVPLIVALATLQMAMSPEEAVSAITINAAAAVGRADRIGSLDVGKAADVVVLAFPSHLFIPYHLGINTVEKVIKNGRLVVDQALPVNPRAGGS